MSEIVKCGFISDPKILKLSENPKNNLDALIGRAVQVKADVVSKDFKESRLREVLNYGHTLAHAIERVEKYQMRHGEAVSIGMVFAAELSAIKCGLSQSNVGAHRKILEGLNLPISYKKNKFNELLALMQGDKKTRGKKLRFIGISKPGKVQWLEDVTESDLKKAYERICL
jgi:3-dehydroquinate synthase